MVIVYNRHKYTQKRKSVKFFDMYEKTERYMLSIRFDLKQKNKTIQNNKKEKNYKK